jgi:hypothetical protein
MQYQMILYFPTIPRRDGQGVKMNQSHLDSAPDFAMTLHHPPPGTALQRGRNGRFSGNQTIIHAKGILTK